MGAFNIGITTVITTNAAYVHESFDTSPGNTIGPTQDVKITASDGAASDEFGYSVAVGHGRIVIGADADDVGSNANQGSAYIYDLDGNNEVKITASDGADGDRFGNSVAVGCGRIVVGAFGVDIGATSNQGSAYIFDLDGNQLAKITASDGAASDTFGSNVAVGCGRIVVGAHGDDFNKGSAYIFDLSGTQLAKITASDGASNDWFGFSVAVGCGRVVVGARFHDLNGLNAPGSAYIFDLSGTQLGIITASDAAAADNFGYSVAVGCGRIVVGSYDDDDNGLSSGSVYIYDLDGNNEVKITASDASAGDQFGHSVAVGCGRIVVGAPLNDDSAQSSGSAYIFDLDGNQLAKITASDPANYDQFGHSYFSNGIAVGCGRIVVGAGLDDIGSNSNQGSAYIFNLPEDSDTYWERILETYKYSS